MDPLVLLALTLAEFHGPSGQRLDINTAEISSIREPTTNSHWGSGTHCVIVMSNGKFMAVAETCDGVRRKLGMGPCTQVCGETRDRRGAGK
jgi:hypothetical protein